MFEYLNILLQAAPVFKIFTFVNLSELNSEITLDSTFCVHSVLLMRNNLADLTFGDLYVSTPKTPKKYREIAGKYKLVIGKP